MKAVGLYRYLPIDHPESLLDEGHVIGKLVLEGW